MGPNPEGQILNAILAVKVDIRDSREKSLVLTKLEEALLWLSKTESIPFSEKVTPAV